MKSSTPGPWDKPWLMGELERLGHCPVCGKPKRTVLHSDLVDNAFRVAPGKWTLWRCENCRSAYLDPRPTPESIHLAYSNYYTHKESSGKVDYATLSPLRKLRRQMLNGYTNWRYSTLFKPSCALGVLIAFAIPSLKKTIDCQYRHLPRLPKGGGTLLDVGCGGGAFLRLAASCGWDVVGLDPDPKAVANAAQKGLAVHKGGIEYFEGNHELFDAITLSHVIEHVHEPLKVLQACHSLLKPGGQLWIETPNIESFGHARFKEHWRGLETPRHLVLMNRNSLKLALVTAGFSSFCDYIRPRAYAGMFVKSFAMQHGCSPYEVMEIPEILKLKKRMIALAGWFLPSRREFLTVAARKKK